MKPSLLQTVILGSWLLAACSGAGDVRPVARSGPQTYVYECEDNYRFPVRIEGRKAWLFLPGNTVSLPSVPAGSGAKYSDGRMFFWSKGETALLEGFAGGRRSCRNNRFLAIWEHAKLNGVDFRAVGNEPGWHLELTGGGKLLFVSDYGQSRYEFNTPEPVSDAGARTTTYRVQNHEHTLVVRITGQACRDTMRGDSFESTVTVTLDGRIHNGCGKALH
jgi:putative lipoprotein